MDHHDKAYAWAERRKLEVHPKTGAAQLVEIHEVVQEIVVPRYIQKDLPLPSQSRLFARVAEEQLLSYGVPPGWVAEVKKATETTLLTLTDHLPAEASEALLELATGGKPKTPQHATVGKNPFDHPDAQRRFRLMAGQPSAQIVLRRTQAGKCDAGCRFPPTSCLAGSRAEVWPILFTQGMGTNGGRLATENLGGVPGRAPSREEDTALRAAAARGMVNLRRGSDYARRSGFAHLSRDVHAGCRRTPRKQEPAFRLRGGGRGARPLGRPFAFPLCAGSRAS